MSKIKKVLIMLYSYGVLPKRIVQKIYNKLNLKGA